MKHFQFSTLMICAVFWTVSSNAQENSLRVSGTVMQIASETVYVNLGRQNGLVDGQRLVVQRNSKQVAELRVVRLADKFSACELVSQQGDILVGDEIIGQIHIQEDRREGVSEDIQDASHAVDLRTPTSEVPVSLSDDVAEIRTLIKGKVALRYSFLDDQTETNRDVHQPALLMDWDVSQIAGTGLRVNFRARARRQSSTGSQSAVRLYDLGVHYESPNKGLVLGMGRLNPAFVSGVGAFDGALLKVHTGYHMNVGVFGGFQPNFQTSGFDSKSQKMGAFVNWERTGFEKVRQNTTLAFVGEYQSGQVQREYFYLQNFIWIGRTVSLFQHVAMDLDRKGQSAQKKVLQLHNAYTTLRVSPTSKLTMSVGYDARNQVTMPLFDSVEDSLLDVAFRQGLRGDISLRPIRSVYLYARGNVRLQKGENNSYAWSLGGSVTNLLRSGVRVRSRFTQIDGDFGQSRDLSFGLARNLGRRIYLDGEWGIYRSVYQTGVETQNRMTGRIQIYLPRRTFLSVEHTVYRGIFKRALTFLELCTRF